MSIDQGAMTAIEDQAARGGNASNPDAITIGEFGELGILDDLQVVKTNGNRGQRGHHHGGNDNDAKFQLWNWPIIFLAARIRQWSSPNPLLMREYREKVAGAIITARSPSRGRRSWSGSFAKSKAGRNVVVGAALQMAAGLVLSHPTPLLEEERDAGSLALHEDREHPLLFHRARTMTAFAANDHPIDCAQVNLAEVFEQRLDGQKANARRCALKTLQPRQPMLAILDADAEPDLAKRRHPAQLTREKLAQSLMPLGEDLVGVPGRSLHHPANLRDEIDWDVVVKEIAHRIHENSLRHAPLERDLQLLRHEAKVETLLERMARDAAKPLREGFGVAVLAAGADLGASANRIPGRIGPFYGA